MSGFLRTRRGVLLAGAVLFVLALAVPAGALLLRDESDHAAAPAEPLEPHPVAGNFEPDGTELAECDADDARCTEQGFGNLAYAEGPEQALARFEAAMRSDSRVESNCHRIAHMIGSAALARHEGDVGEAFARGSATCWSGYYHGILERAFADLDSRDEAGPVARELCRGERIEATQFLLYQCVHGLGHGLMIHSGYDLPWALRICDELADQWSQSSCTGGVFMENIASSYGIRSEWLRDDDGIYPCQEMAERHKYYCYLMATSRVNELNGFDWEETAAACEGAEPDWVAICFESYGRDASGYTRQDPRRIVELCDLTGSRANVTRCVYGAARDVTSNDAGGERARALCEEAARPHRSECYAGIGTIVATLHATEAEKRRACRDLAPAAFRGACEAGAGLAAG